MHRTRRTTAKALLTCATMALFWPISNAAIAQPADKTLRVGILSSGILDNRDALDKAFVQSLRDQGYVEGKNLTIERRSAQASFSTTLTSLRA